MKRYSLLITLLLAISFAAFSQKLPNIQDKSVSAPGNIKVDGKPTEWNNQFQAYNNSTNLFYTICNDNENLYLIFQATDPVYVTKILSGGITLVVNKSGKKSEDNAISITYPIIDPKDKPNVHFQNVPKLIQGNKASIVAADSFMNDNNQRIMNKFKWIRVTGITGLDTLTSIYNREGIKAAGLFNNTMAYTCEFSVSLKNLDLTAKNSQKLAYHIVSNGININNLDGGPNTAPPPPSSRPGTLSSMEGPPQAGYNFNRGDFKSLISTTDFWGEYTIVRK